MSCACCVGFVCKTCDCRGTPRQPGKECDVQHEQFHRIGKDGGRYWGKLGAGIVFTDGNSILLLKRSNKGDNPGTWAIPGGKAKEGESPVETARRESAEECGQNQGQMVETWHDKDGSHHFHVFLYKIAKPFEVKLSDEHTDSKWVPLNDVKSMVLHPKFEASWPVYHRAIVKKISKIPTFSEWITAKKS